jgi:hypothetical protein
MNRSLEALAIFTICLGGILAVVRISTKDQAGASRKMAERPAVPAASEQGSRSAGELPSAAPVAAKLAASEPGDSVFSFAQGCGLDRSTGDVYSAFPPVISHAEVVQRVIRSQPLPIYVLPDAESADVLANATEDTAEDAATSERTEYDAAYDEALFHVGEEAVLLDSETAREYAAAELAAAGVVPAEIMPEQTTADVYAPWQLLSGRWDAAQASLSHGFEHYHDCYLAPARRALENRWSSSEWPRLLEHPRAKAEARRQLLQHQRAAAERAGRVSWDDYVAFADRHLQLTPAQPSPAAISQALKSQGLQVWQRSTRTLASYVQLAEACLHGTSERLGRIAAHDDDEPLWQSR